MSHLNARHCPHHQLISFHPLETASLIFQKDNGVGKRRLCSLECLLEERIYESLIQCLSVSNSLQAQKLPFIKDPWSLTWKKCQKNQCPAFILSFFQQPVRLWSIKAQIIAVTPESHFSVLCLEQFMQLLSTDLGCLLEGKDSCCCGPRQLGSQGTKSDRTEWNTGLMDT